MPRTDNHQLDREQTIWTMLRWQGHISNTEVRELFCVSLKRASQILQQFRLRFPSSLIQDNHNRFWRLAAAKQADDIAGSIEQYLTLVRSLKSNPTEWYEDARFQFLNPKPEIFRLVRDACETGKGLLVSYASMGREAPLERLIFPHAILRLCQRWHTRAWCCLREEYRDFTFGRMMAIREADEARPVMPPDEAWNRYVPVRVFPHRELTSTQIEVVRSDFCGGAVARRIMIRACEVPYALRDSRVAINPEIQKPPEYLLELANAEELEPYLFKIPAQND